MVVILGHDDLIIQYIFNESNKSHMSFTLMILSIDINRKNLIFLSTWKQISKMNGQDNSHVT